MAETASGSRQKQAGERVEGAVVQREPALDTVPDRVDEHYDAVAVNAFEPPAAVAAEVDVVPRGTRVEIKSAMARYASDERGRFYFRRNQHQRLRELDGLYVLNVCEPKPSREIITQKMIAPSTLDDYVDDWFNGGNGRADYLQLAWSNFIDTAEVER